MPGAGDACARGGRRVVGVVAAAHCAARLPRVLAGRSEAERRLEQLAARLGRGGERPHAVEAAERVLGGHLGVLRRQRRVGGVDDRQLEPEALGVVEPEPAGAAVRRDPLGAEPRLPEVERLLRADAERDRVHHPRAGTAAACARVLEERDVRAGAARLVCVEQVVHRRVVLVDGLLDHPQAEHAGVEVDVARSVAGDAGHVVDAFEAHDLLLASFECHCSIQAPRPARVSCPDSDGAGDRREVRAGPRPLSSPREDRHRGAFLVVVLGRRRRARRAPGRSARGAWARGTAGDGQRPAGSVHARPPPPGRPPRRPAGERDRDRALGDRARERLASEHHPQPSCHLPDQARARAGAVRRAPPPRADDAGDVHLGARARDGADRRHAPRVGRPRLDEARDPRLGLPREPHRPANRRLRARPRVGRRAGCPATTRSSRTACSSPTASIRRDASTRSPSPAGRRPRKGLQVLLRAWPEIHRRTGARLQICGSDPLAVRLLLTRLRISDDGHRHPRLPAAGGADEPARRGRRRSSRRRSAARASAWC